MAVCMLEFHRVLSGPVWKFTIASPAVLAVCCLACAHRVAFALDLIHRVAAATLHLLAKSQLFTM